MPGEIVLLLCLIPMAAAGTTAPSLSASPIVFARNLFRALNEESPKVNLVISPAAARSALTLVFMGAGGKSADELRSVLMLGAAGKNEIAKQHAEFWSKECTCSEKGAALRLVTRLYVNDDLPLRPDFNLKAVEFFNAQADALNYSDADASMRQVNKWLELQTFHTVRNLLTPATFNPESSVILVNSIYFRAKWAKRFSMDRTAPEDFWINPTQRMELAMMRQIGQFRYAESKKLQATILQLPFEDSDISMMLIVPNQVDGLPDLEEKLAQLDMNEVATKGLQHEVDVTMPMFKIECDIDLKVPMQKLGISRILKPDQADLSGLFAKKTPQLISEARHKLYLYVNESGCETDPDTPARAAAFVQNPDRKIFKADRPFVFAIRNNRTVYFVGHFIKP
ncbi:serine protease inhibitor 42Dd isoform X2 [Drosophila obscura]|uniref:serine protease inhibitor 42Dd isoform X2 n=1 Tax=Drosophila obscura TaxID=7282 RepID=UPI001BB298D4|nr:serine protease inhibitor 42Dd isoform X2 [Drosophila obscura]